MPQQRLLAREMINITRGINSDYLSDRTVGGMMADLRLHFAAYFVDVFDLTHRDSTARIGGMNSNKPGFDDNAWFFETANVVTSAHQFLLDPNTLARNIEDMWGRLFR
jgi:hypothetical protein